LATVRKQFYVTSLALDGGRRRFFDKQLLSIALSSMASAKRSRACFAPASCSLKDRDDLLFRVPQSSFARGPVGALSGTVAAECDCDQVLNPIYRMPTNFEG
jgi:hypothetical protein